MHFGIAELGKRGGKLHGFVQLAGREKQGADIDFIGFQRRFAVSRQRQDADDVVHAVFVDRQTGELIRIRQNGTEIFFGIVDVQRNHVDTGRHDFLKSDIVEIQHGLKQFALSFVDNAFFLNGIDDGNELFFRDGRLVAAVIFAPEFAQDIQQCHYDEHDGRENDGQNAGGKGDKPNHCIRMLFRQNFRNNFAEDQNDNRYKDSGDGRGKCHIVLEQIHDDQGSAGGNRDVGQVVADENGRKCSGEILADPVRCTGGETSAFRSLAKTHLIGCVEGNFRSGEVRRQADHDENNQISPPHFGKMFTECHASTSSSSRDGEDSAQASSSRMWIIT